MTTWRRRFVGSAVFAVAAGSSARAQSVDAARKSEVDALLQRAVESGDVPGVIAMATDRNGVIYEAAYGKRVLGQPAEMTTDTVVWIASMSKALTSAGAMQLVEQGKLDLDAPAAKIVPEIATTEVLEGFDVAGQPRTRPPKRAITLRHLLTHTAGFGYDIWSADLVKYQAAKNIPGNKIVMQRYFMSGPHLLPSCQAAFGSLERREAAAFLFDQIILHATSLLGGLKYPGPG